MLKSRKVSKKEIIILAVMFVVMTGTMIASFYSSLQYDPCPLGYIIIGAPALYILFTIIYVIIGKEFILFMLMALVSMAITCPIMHVASFGFFLIYWALMALACAMGLLIVNVAKKIVRKCY